MAILFKTPRIEKEFTEQLAKENPRLKAMICAIDLYCGLEFNKNITLTDLFRTADEHKALYAQTPNPPASSPHCNFEAVDLRSRDFTDEEVKKIVNFANQFTFRNGKPSALAHAIAGGAFHLHIQTRKVF